MSDDRRYVVVKEPDFAWCRLRLADSPDVSGLQVLWEGNGLRAGYDAMIRLNKDMKPTKLYHVSQKGRAFRVTKEPQPETWKHLQVLSSYEAAREFVKEARKKLLHDLREAGVEVGQQMPGVTVADVQYLDWLKSRKASEPSQPESGSRAA